MVNEVSSTNPGLLPPCISVGILAWNEEEAIGAALTSLFRQSLFAQLSQRGLRCEILCVANGCTDRTPAIAGEIFQAQSRGHAFKETFVCRSLNLQERGKTTAWNLFIHSLSAREAQFLFLMDGDIVLRHQDTLWNMYDALNLHPEASLATDRALKDISFQSRPSLRERVSLATSRMTQGGTAQVTGQLYCIRTAVARNIYLPKDLAACEDGFIKSLVCSSFLTQESSPERVIAAPNASHIFQAYTTPAEILRNQKRQMMGQTIVHILVDGYLKGLAPEEKLNLAGTLCKREEADPDWLKRLIAAHLKQARVFWRLFPGLLTFRFQRLAQMRGSTRLLHLPAAIAGFVVTLAATWLAHRSLKRGSTQYWPDTRSGRLKEMASRAPLPSGDGIGTAEPSGSWKQIGVERTVSSKPVV